MIGIQHRLKNSRTAAVCVMTAVLLLVLILPLSVALLTIVRNYDQIANLTREFLTEGLPQPPEWVHTRPLVGEKVAAFWGDAAAWGRDEVLTKIAPYMGHFFTWFMGQVGSFGMLFVHFLLTVIISAILYMHGETAGGAIIKFARKLAEDQGAKVVILAGQAIRAVAMGVVITAFIQSVMAGIGFAIAGVPFAMFLASVVFLLAVIQIGAGPILLIAIIWLYSKSTVLTATLFLVWSVLIMIVDNFVRPLLIRGGANLPLLLIFAGIIGGLISFGVVGLFVGPVVLAVSYTLMKAWMEEEQATA